MHNVNLRKLIRYWKSNDKNVQYGPSKEIDVIHFEEKYDLKFPSDFRIYLLEACRKKADMDRDLTTWWPLSDLKKLSDEFKYPLKNPEIGKNAEQFVVFADYSIWCWAWAICCKQGKNYGRVALIYGDGEFVARTFSDFIEIYINESIQVL